MVASVIDVRQPGKPAFGRQGIDTKSKGLVLGFSHRCNRVSLAGIVPLAVPINLMEVQ